MPPRPKIPAHVFFYALASIPGVGYAMYWRQNRSSDEDFEEMLRKNYGSKIESSRSKREGMVDVIGGLKARDPATELKFAEVLRGGKSGVASKRQNAVDETLYGTEEGVKRKEMFEKEQEEIRRKKMKKKRKKMKQAHGDEMILEGGGGEKGGHKKVGKKKKKKKRKGNIEDGISEEKILVDSKQAKALVVLGASLALVTSILIRGRKS